MIKASKYLDAILIKLLDLKLTLIFIKSKKNNLKYKKPK